MQLITSRSPSRALRAPDGLGTRIYGSIKDAPSGVSFARSGKALYIGANGGYAWGDNNGGDIEVFDEDKKGSRTSSACRQVASSRPGRNYDLGLQAWASRAFQVGFNRRAGNFVFGLEADFQTRVDGGSTTKFDPPAIFNFDYTASLDVEWFGTLRGRVGYARDRTLIYATAGLAFGEVSYNARYFITEPCCSGGFANPSRAAASRRAT